MNASWLGKTGGGGDSIEIKEISLFMPEVWALVVPGVFLDLGGHSGWMVLLVVLHDAICRFNFVSRSIFWITIERR